MAALDSKGLLLQCLDMSLLTHLQTLILVKNTPKLRKLSPNQNWNVLPPVPN